MSVDVLAKFPDAKRAGEGWSAKCPAHDDHRNSLSIGHVDNGQWLLKCHRGCRLDEVLATVGLRKRDLFPETTTKTSTKKTILATYDYTDKFGALLYQVVRYDPKDFRQRRPDGAGGWIWTLGDVPRVLYRRKELEGATTVVIPEGEKDADNIVQKLGYQATTNVGGAGKWKRIYMEQLVEAGAKHAILLGDNDEPGRHHVLAVAHDLHAARLQVKVLTLPELPPKGDISDWLAQPGHDKGAFAALVASTPLFDPVLSPFSPPQALTSVSATPTRRTIHLTAASSIKVRPVRWLWKDRMALGTLGLLGGREGVGKTICAYTLAASITRGTLPGVFLGTPRAVIVAATEDSWEHTIVPRLMAAGADLDRIYRVDVVTSEGTDTTLSLPRDLGALERAVREVQAAFIILDPLLSRLDTALDTHKDAEVRVALEPLVTLAGATETGVLGLIHVNKSASSDVLTLLMGSRAFAAVARAVIFVMVDPDDDGVRLLGQAKNNLGRCDLPTLAFRIVGACVADTPEGPVWTGKLEWLGEADRSIKDAIESAAESTGDRTATSEAADWLHDYLTSQGGTIDSASLKREGAKAGHSADALKRARQRLRIVSEGRGFPRRTYWTLPSQSAQQAGETRTTPLTEHQPAQSAQLVQSETAPAVDAEESNEDDRWTL